MEIQWIVRPIKAFFADKKAFFWPRPSSAGLSTRWLLKGLVIGLPWLLPVLITSMKALLTAVLLLASAAPAALAQKEIPKAEAMTSALWVTSTRWGPPAFHPSTTRWLQPGKACKEGWMNIGAGYCKKRRGLSESCDRDAGYCLLYSLQSNEHMTPSYPPK